MTAQPMTLSSLPHELLEVIVGKVVRREDLKTLALTERKFAPICQARLFEVFQLSPDKRQMQSKLKRGFALFQKNPALARLVRRIRIAPEGTDCGWVFHDNIFKASVQLLAASSRPPVALEIIPQLHGFSVLRDRTFILRRMFQTFLPTSLTTLVIKRCMNVPLTLFLLSPNLRVVELEDTKLSQIDLESKRVVEVDEDSVIQLPKAHEENAWYEREAPALVELRYSNSGQVISAFLDPPSHAPRGIVKLSELQRLYLKANPVKKGWKRFQRILNQAQASLVDLEVAFPHLYSGTDINASLSGRLDPGGLTVLHTLSLPLLIQGSDPNHRSLVKGLSKSLSTLPTPNRLSSLTISCTAWGSETGSNAVTVVLSQNWAGLGTELIRIAGGRRLDVTVQFAWGGKARWQQQSDNRSRIHSHLTDELNFVARMPNIKLQVVDLGIPVAYR
ncbi:hypothetical protein BKA70DRAFT_1334381 [Coprinopsis sp. MPI-PUGE-AT-0042]|nr:hypothetical protein BKA70DRAFT_1334381 [Coprinopsis sp. MPI-PUGE-AT-0042]